MRTVDVLFSVMLGIALGNILGNTWSNTPAMLVAYQLAFVCATWCGLRVLFALLGLAFKSASESPYARWSQWRNWLLDEDFEDDLPAPTTKFMASDYRPASPNTPADGLPRMFLSEWPNLQDRR